MKKIIILLMALVLCVSMVSSVSLPDDVVDYVKTCYLTGQGGYSVNGYYVLNDCKLTNSYELAKLDAKNMLKGVFYGF
jgi:hypothetical protein